MSQIKLNDVKYCFGTTSDYFYVKFYMILEIVDFLVKTRIDNKVAFGPHQLCSTLQIMQIMIPAQLMVNGPSMGWVSLL